MHTIFGAFLLGLAFPQRNSSTLRLAKTIEDFASIVFLPLYFAASGLRTQVRAVITTETLIGILVFSSWSALPQHLLFSFHLPFHRSSSDCEPL